MGAGRLLKVCSAMLDGRTGNGRSPVGSALCLCQEYLSGARLVWGKVNASLQVAGIIWGHSVSKFGLKDASVVLEFGILVLVPQSLETQPFV